MDKNIENISQSNKLQNQLNQKIQSNSNVFDVGSLFSFISKKTEKLATAVYMVTNLLYENEPMKWILRKKVSDLLSFILKHRDTYMTGNVEFVYDAKKYIAEVLSLLEVTSGSGLISPMNFSVIQNEFIGLIEQIEKLTQEQITRDHRELPTAFFDISRSHGQIQSSISDRNSMSDRSIKDTEHSTKAESVVKRTNRQNIILNMLKKKKELSIKDVALVIKDCSEKTIQRELIDLIEKGVLDKVGERRWSKYTLANPL